MTGTNNLSLSQKAMFFVMCAINNERESKGLKRHKFKDDEVRLVWFSKTLENWKALVIITFEDVLYYEVTHSGSKKETYVDAYEKVLNVCFPDEDD